MLVRNYNPQLNNPHDVKDWVISATRSVPTGKLKDCSVHMTHAVRNKLFTTLGVAGGEKPVLFGIPVQLMSGSDYHVTLRIPD